MPKIKVALVGVGNCASALVQGWHYYRKFEKKADAVGLKHLFLSSYHPRDIEFVAAFDVETRKVGKDLSRAIFAAPNNTNKFIEVPYLKVPVLKGHVLDGICTLLKNVVTIDNTPESDVAKHLKDSDSEIVVNLLPSGATKASELYAEEALKAGCAFINATIVSLASDAYWSKLYQKAGLPIIGDDLKDQIGATILHKSLLKTLVDRGVRISETYQLDVGGGTESLDTLYRTKKMKRNLKTKSVETALPYKASVVAGSTDYVDFLENRRDSYFFVKGTYFGGALMQLDMRLNSLDAPNAGSILFDVIRAAKIALDREIAGPILSVSAYAFKRPPNFISVEEAEELFGEFIQGKVEQ